MRRAAPTGWQKGVRLDRASQLLLAEKIEAGQRHVFSRRFRQAEYRARLLSRVPQQSVCAEIGVYRGDFTQLILNTTNPKKLHLIDPWKFEIDPAYAHSWYGGSSGRSQSNMDAIYESVLRRFRSAIESGAVEVHRNMSSQQCSNFKDKYFDWIYIDGNHQYEFVKQDLEMYLPKIKTEGLIAGDDYGRPGWWQDGVTKAVDEAVQAGHFERLLIEDHQFLLRKT